MKPLKRLFLLLMFLLWLITFGLIYVVLYFPILILSGNAGAERWENFIGKSGDFITDALEESLN